MSLASTYERSIPCVRCSSSPALSRRRWRSARRHWRRRRPAQRFTVHDQFVDADTCAFPGRRRHGVHERHQGDLRRRRDRDGSAAPVARARVIHRERHDAEDQRPGDDPRGLRRRHRSNGKARRLAQPIVGPGGPVFLRSGQALFEVVGGFDGPLIARHGLRDVFDPRPSARRSHESAGTRCL